MQQSQHFLFVEALMKRIRMEDLEAPTIENEFYRLEAGLSGEQKLKRRLSDYYFKTDAHIFYNFECKNSKGFTHQIDALLLTPNFVVVMEVKQMSGTLFYKPTLHEFSRVQDNVSENSPNPFDQAYRHQLFLQHQLKIWQISIPVYHIVVLANYRAKLDNSLNTFPIMHMSGIPRFIEKLYTQHPNPHANITFLQNQLQQLYEQLPPRRTIEKHRLRTGVLCEKCNYTNEMHSVSPRISNKEFREFFNSFPKEVSHPQDI